MGSRESKAAALPGSGLVADVDKAQLEVHEMVYQKGVIDGSAEVLKQYESQRREWSAEKQKIMRAKVSEMLALEDKHTDAVSTKVAELQEAQRILKECDADGDGTIDQEVKPCHSDVVWHRCALSPLDAGDGPERCFESLCMSRLVRNSAGAVLM